MWIEKRRQQHRVYYRNPDPNHTPRKSYVPFESRDMAQTFIDLARMCSLTGALGYIADPSPETLDRLLGARLGTPTGTSALVGDQVSLATDATRGVTGPDAGVMDRFSPTVGVTFRAVWAKFIREQRHLEEGVADLYTSYWEIHFEPFFGDVDLGLIRRARPLRDAVEGSIYVDDWVEKMLAKPRLNNVRMPIKDTRLSLKFIKNVHTVLAQVFDVALQERPVLIEVNPAREIRLPKQDRREMYFLENAAAYDLLDSAMHEHFRPLLAFLGGTGARFGEAAGLLVRNAHLDVERPYIEIRQILKWVRKKWRLGRPKTKSSVRRISLSPKLVELVRVLIEGKAGDEHVFTMIEGSPLHHGNFHKRYFRPAVEKAGGNVPKRLRIHDLRHTHAAWLLSSGVPAFMVQRRLGHSSSATTTDVYGHFTPEADDNALALIDRHLPDILGVEPDGDGPVRLSRAEATLPEFDVDDLDDLAA
jgi:integrase